MENDMNQFLAVYHQIMLWTALGFTVIALLIYVYHNIKLATISEYKSKYDFVNNNEIKNYRLSFYSLSVTIFCLINTYGSGTLEFDEAWFFVRLFISIAGATMIGYIGSLILKYYYPTKLDKKLKKWRYTPRINPKTGNKMRLLSETEEDVHLDEGMQAEEEVFSVDYDVWFDEETGDTKIEKYQGHLEALQCNNCGFYTMKVVKEEILKDSGEGELLKHYECTYCGSIRATQFNIASKDEDYSHMDPHFLKYDTTKIVSSVKIDIHATDGHKKTYTFQNIEQATKFLEEFDYDKIVD